jgi:hypothetical protein
VRLEFKSFELESVECTLKNVHKQDGDLFFTIQTDANTEIQTESNRFVVFFYFFTVFLVDFILFRS